MPLGVHMGLTALDGTESFALAGGVLAEARLGGVIAVLVTLLAVDLQNGK